MLRQTTALTNAIRITLDLKSKCVLIDNTKVEQLEDERVVEIVPAPLIFAVTRPALRPPLDGPTSFFFPAWRLGWSKRLEFIA